jgi:hypothetical protein
MANSWLLTHSVAAIATHLSSTCRVLLLPELLQVDPQLAKDAEMAIDALIKELPQDLVEQAQQYRVSRANGKA